MIVLVVVESERASLPEVLAVYIRYLLIFADVLIFHDRVTLLFPTTAFRFVGGFTANELVMVIILDPITPDPSLAVAVTVTEPTAFAVRRPVALIVAIFELLTLQITEVSGAFLGRMFVSICNVALIMSVVTPFFPYTTILVTGILVIVITLDPTTPEPSFAVAVTVTVPTAIAVRRPVLLIVAKFV